MFEKATHEVFSYYGLWMDLGSFDKKQSGWEVSNIKITGDSFIIRKLEYY